MNLNLIKWKPMIAALPITMGVVLLKSGVVLGLGYDVALLDMPET